MSAAGITGYPKEFYIKKAPVSNKKNPNIEKIKNFISNVFRSVNGFYFGVYSNVQRNKEIKERRDSSKKNPNIEKIKNFISNVFRSVNGFYFGVYSNVQRNKEIKEHRASFNCCSFRDFLRDTATL